MPRFTKKPVEIEAVRWMGDNFDDILAMVNFDDLPKDEVNVGGPGIGYIPALGEIYIPTLEGEMTLTLGNWFIKGVQGEFYPCKHEIFLKTYDAVDYDGQAMMGGENAKKDS